MLVDELGIGDESDLTFPGHGEGPGAAGDGEEINDVFEEKESDYPDEAKNGER
jgi:hypothetical protein